MLGSSQGTLHQPPFSAARACPSSRRGPINVSGVPASRTQIRSCDRTLLDVRPSDAGSGPPRRRRRQRRSPWGSWLAALRRSLGAELAAAEGLDVLGVFWDAEKYYDKMRNWPTAPKAARLHTVPGEERELGRPIHSIRLSAPVTWRASSARRGRRLLPNHGSSLQLPQRQIFLGGHPPAASACLL